MSGIKDILVKAKRPVVTQKKGKEPKKNDKNGFQSVVDKATRIYNAEKGNRQPAGEPFFKGRGA